MWGCWLLACTGLVHSACDRDVPPCVVPANHLVLAAFHADNQGPSRDALRTKCHPSKVVICMQLAAVEWTNQPTYTVPLEGGTMQHHIGIHL